MEDKFKLFILKLNKEVLQLYHLQLKISEDKLHNGKFGILILKILKKKVNKIKKDNKQLFKRKLYNLEDILHHF
jgi:hypothetical protein